MTDVAPTVRLAVRHETLYRYDAPVEVAHHSAWLRPRDTGSQRITGWTLQVDPPPQGDVQESRDAFGNWRHVFVHAQSHDRLRVVSAFQAELTATPSPQAADSAAWEQVALELRYHAGATQPDAVEFALGTPFAPCDARLRDFGAALFVPGRPLLDLALALSAQVHRTMAYRPHSTDVATSAPQALAQGQGVCQDFAHLMIGTLRSWGLAARYVSGYLLTQPPPGQPRLTGADASHAWVAVWCPPLGWISLDPTNDCLAGTDHVEVAWGRDYADVAPLRGVIRGGGSVAPEVAVSVVPVGDGAAGAAGASA